MNARLTILIVAILVCGCKDKTSVQKDVGYWLIQLKSSEQKMRLEAISHFYENPVLDKDVVEALVKIRDSQPDSEERKAADITLGRMEVIEKVSLLSSPDAGVRWSAAWDLGYNYRGSFAMHRDPPPPPNRGYVGLEGIVVEGLIKALKDSDGMVRGRAAEALGDFGDKGSSAVPELTRVLRQDSDTWVRNRCGYSLGYIGSPLAVPALEEALHDPEAKVRMAAADGLSELGKKASNTLPALRKLAKEDTDAQVRQSAIEAIHMIEKNI